MNPSRVILATEAGALTVNVYGDIAGSNGQGKMPRPRAIVATLFLYGVLGWAAEFGRQAGRVAAAVGVVLFLTLLVGNGTAGSGAGGKSLLDLLGSFTSHLRTQDQGGSNG